MGGKKDRTTVSVALDLAIKTLTGAGIPDARVEAEYFLTHLLACKRHELFLNPDRPLDAEESALFTAFIQRRLGREPVQYITGVVEFYGLELRVTKDVLIPRPETELLVDAAMQTLPQKASVAIDLCTGSGCIAVTLAVKIPDITIFATDISASALKVAEENAVAHNVSDRVHLLQGDLYAALDDAGVEGRADLILSNPPYVADDEYARLQPEIRLYEPRTALLAGPDGLEFYRRIINGAGLYLAPKGCIIMEAGYGQADRIREIIEADGRYADFEIKKDLAGIERVVKARLK